MASPALESFCCLFRPNTTSDFRPSFHGVDLKTVLYSYNVLCALSAAVSIGAAFYQMCLHKSHSFPRARKELESFVRQNMILCWLTVADSLASFGVLLRSAVWMAGFMPSSKLTSQTDFTHLFCAVSSAWIQYFYICTYFWTFCYALDIYFLLEDHTSKMRSYHFFSWLIPSVLCVGGLLPIYMPSLLRCELSLSHLIPHYLSTYVPILAVMIAQPVLYIKSSMLVKLELKHGGRFTDQEREVVTNVRHKFCQVTLVFYVCWLPNIINGVLMLVLDNSNVPIYLALWIFMAVLNPLQAFLNTVVYSGAGGWLWCRCTDATPRHVTRNHVQAALADDSTETSSLLSFRR